MGDVRTLRNLDGMSPDLDAMPTTSDKDHESSNWSSVTVYIIGERFSRGLDLPDVEYVVMLSPPSSAAGYAHMAGRTGRVGRAGTAITLVRPKNNEVQRLAAIAEALGLKFAESLSGVAGGERMGLDAATVVHDEAKAAASEGENNEHDIAQHVSEEESSYISCQSAYPWELMSESALGRKKNDELHQYLVSCGVDTIDTRSKKAELVSAVLELHSKM